MIEIMVSVIIPVYNGERYIRHAVECVLGQTYRDWELILIDDGSTDSTSQICREYANLPQVRYLRNEQNAGVSTARNRGMDAALGRYIVFMDADDDMGEDSLKVRVELMEKHELDMGVFNYRIINEKKAVTRKLVGLGSFDTVGFWGRIADFQAGISLGIDCVWDKIFRTDRIRENGVRFREDWNMSEDCLFCLEYVSACHRRIEVKDICVVDYYMRKDNENSLSQKFHRKEFKDTFRAIYDYFLCLKCCLKLNALFAESIKDGFYHGYVNKVIGEIYHYIKMGEDRSQLGLIFENGEFLTGLECYRCRNEKEDPRIIEILKLKDVERLCDYAVIRLGGE